MKWQTTVVVQLLYYALASVKLLYNHCRWIIFSVYLGNLFALRPAYDFVKIDSFFVCEVFEWPGECLVWRGRGGSLDVLVREPKHKPLPSKTPSSIQLIFLFIFITHTRAACSSHLRGPLTYFVEHQIKQTAYQL